MSVLLPIYIREFSSCSLPFVPTIRNHCREASEPPEGRARSCNRLNAPARVPCNQRAIVARLTECRAKRRAPGRAYSLVVRRPRSRSLPSAEIPTPRFVSLLCSR